MREIRWFIAIVWLSATLIAGSFGVGAASGGVVAAESAATSEAGPRGSLKPPLKETQAGTVLGFELEEERHYVLGPPETLERGESATWIISLAEVEGAGRDLRATFTLKHTREAPRSLESPWRSGEVTHANVDAKIVVNAYGAPLEITYVSQRHVYDLGDEVFQVDYLFEGDKYQKRTTLQGAKWDLDIELIEHENLNPAVPLGLFAFAPGALDCMEWRVGTVIEHRTGTGDVSPDGPGRTIDDEGRATVEGAALASGQCYDTNTDPAFANPGLASLAMTLLWENRGDAELVLFSPLRPDLVRGQGNGVPLTFSPILPVGSGGPGGSVLSGIIPGLDWGTVLGGGGADGDKDRARDPGRYFFPRRLRLSDRQRIQVGLRKMDALPMDVAGFAGTVWVDDWGKVVRLDVPPLRFGDPERWVRILHASEY